MIINFITEYLPEVVDDNDFFFKNHGITNDDITAKSDIKQRRYTSPAENPAGLVSRMKGSRIEDKDWQESFIAKAIVHQRNVVPIFFYGSNSRLFLRHLHWSENIGN
jgi:hypothetical protein